MGSNNSRLNAAGGDVMPVVIRPLLRRRFEELRKRRNAATIREGTLSKKQLLKDTVEEDDKSQPSRETETEDKVSPKEAQPAKEEAVARVVTVEKMSKVVPLPVSECRTVEEKDGNNVSSTEQKNRHKDGDQEKVKDVDKKAEVEVKTERGKIAGPEPENEDEETDAETDEEEEEDEEIGRLICPGSPSFRIYCIEAEKIKEQESENQTIAMQRKLPSADSDERAASASENLGNSNEGVYIESTTKRKRDKIKKSMKNLLQGKSRYNTMFTCTGNDKGRLLEAN